MSDALAKLGPFAWTLHNLVAHPVSEIVWLVGLGSKRAERLSNWIHDATVPGHGPGEAEADVSQPAPRQGRHPVPRHQTTVGVAVTDELDCGCDPMEHLLPCDLCGEPWCPTHQQHWHECPCPGFHDDEDEDDRLHEGEVQQPAGEPGVP
jgi:hypothetical protein